LLALVGVLLGAAWSAVGVVAAERLVGRAGRDDRGADDVGLVDFFHLAERGEVAVEAYPQDGLGLRIDLTHCYLRLGKGTLIPHRPPRSAGLRGELLGVSACTGT